MYECMYLALISSHSKLACCHPVTVPSESYGSTAVLMCGSCYKLWFIWLLESDMSILFHCTSCKDHERRTCGVGTHLLCYLLMISTTQRGQYTTWETYNIIIICKGKDFPPLYRPRSLNIAAELCWAPSHYESMMTLRRHRTLQDAATSYTPGCFWYCPMSQDAYRHDTQLINSSSRRESRTCISSHSSITRPALLK